MFWRKKDRPPKPKPELPRFRLVRFRIVTTVGEQFVDCHEWSLSDRVFQCSKFEDDLRPYMGRQTISFPLHNLVSYEEVAPDA